MQRKLRFGYFAHSLRSDWNNGNAHFLRGLLRSLGKLGHGVTGFEAEADWSIDHLSMEAQGARSIQRFMETYSDLDIETYSADDSDDLWRSRLKGLDVVILHEWNRPVLAQLLLRLRAGCGYQLMFHDTHHRASSSPEQIKLFGLEEFDGILAFGNALRELYREQFGFKRVWTLHEAADTSVFKPRREVFDGVARECKIVWIGNWGEGERSEEIRRFLLEPAWALRDIARTVIYGVRYPEEGLNALEQNGVEYGGYLANLDAPEVYAGAGATVHVPRQQYSGAMKGIPTIRVFEALACGIPLVSAPWEDTEQLFRPGDFRWANSGGEMESSLRLLLTDRVTRDEQIACGLETILARHTCDHRAEELSRICYEVLR